MSGNLFEKRKLEFIQIVTKEKRLPQVWEFRFSDGEDMRIWFNKVSKLEKFQAFLNEINNILAGHGKKILNDKDKEEEFLNCIKRLNRIPRKQEACFSDNDDMYMWYMNYKNKNKGFETLVHNSLREYQELDLATIWPLVKQEFISIIKNLRRVPQHGEVILQNNIDVRVIYDKLETYDPTFFEKLLLHLQTYTKKGLSIDQRIAELKAVISNLGYIPYLQEARFTDGTDMFTWYMKYKDKLPNLETELNSLVHSENPHKRVNIYLIPNFRNNGGKFYTICTNEGERLDLSNITSFEEAKKMDDTLVKRGGLILKRTEEIGSVSFGKGKNK